MDYQGIIEGLRETFNSGHTKPISWRKEQLRQLVKMFDENLNEFSESLKLDLGKCREEAVMTEMDFTKFDAINALNNLEKWMKPKYVKKNLASVMDSCYIQSEPFGVVLNVSAWNYPVQISFLPIIGAIAAGNCVVIKPSEISSHTSSLIEKLVPKYLDQDAIKVIVGGVPETTQLLKERFDLIIYTGGSTVAKIIMTAAAQHLTPVLLELGGKSPAYVAEDSDLNLASRRIVWGKLMNSGQTCIAPDYVICDKSIEAKLKEGIVKTIKDFYGEQPDLSPHYGRIINERHFDRLLALLDGADVYYGGNTNKESRFFGPTVVQNVKPNDTIMQEEIFGPILPILTVDSVGEAIELINQKDKPLAMYLFSQNSSVIDEFLSKTSSGGVCVNDTIMHQTLNSLPFGGVGKSGMGAYHGKSSFDSCSHHRSVMHKAQKMELLNDLRYPPFSETKLKRANWLMRKTEKQGWSSYLSFFVISLVFAILFKM